MSYSPTEKLSSRYSTKVIKGSKFKDINFKDIRCQKLRLPRKVKKDLKKTFGDKSFKKWVSCQGGWVGYVYMPYIMEQSTDCLIQ